MSRSLCSLLLLLIVSGPALIAAEHYIFTTIGVCDTPLACTSPLASPAWDSGAWVESRLLGYPYPANMHNDHSVYEDNAKLVGTRVFEKIVTDWHSYLIGAPRAGHCYNSHLVSIAGTSVKSVPSSPWHVCWFGPEVPITEPDKNCEPVWDPEGELYQENCDTPILLSLNDGAYVLTSPTEGVSFDIRADGVRRRVSWTEAGSDLAFLALDRNGNGKIDSGAELFGNAMPLLSGARAEHGFQALAQFDENGDGAIDSADAVWASLLLWNDENHDGVSTLSELQPLEARRLVSLATTFHVNNRRDPDGNLFRYMSTFVIRGEHRAAPIHRPYYDILLRSMTE